VFNKAGPGWDFIKKPPDCSSAGFWCREPRCGCRRCLWGDAGAGAVQPGWQELWGASPGRGAPRGRGGAGQLCLLCRGEAFGFLTAACGRNHRAKLQVKRGEPGRARCREAARARAGGSIHGPVCPREVRAASESVPCLPAPMFLLPAPGVPCHPEQGGHAQTGAEREVGPSAGC